MPNEQDKKCQGKQETQNPKRSNDQLGENAGEGRLMKDQGKKSKIEKKKLQAKVLLNCKTASQ